jgi:4-amino-4-deoxy-L-arabinose transferase-like glycosyltransferase
VFTNVKIPQKWAVFLFLLAITPRLLYLASIPGEAVLESVDAKGYDLIARNLLAGHGFSRQDAPPYHPDGLRTPLYPSFIVTIYALSGWILTPPGGSLAVAFTQTLLDGLTAVIVANLAALLLGQWWVLAAGLMYALTPVQWRYSAALLPEVPLAFLVALAMWLLFLFSELAEQRGASGARDRTARWVAAGCGIVCGLIALCKPNLSGVFLVISGAALVSAIGQPTHTQWKRSTLRSLRRFRPGLVYASIIAVAAATLVGPWVVRNRIVFGRPFLSNAAWGFLARVSAPATLGVLQDRRVPPWSTEWEARYHTIVEQTATTHDWRPRLAKDITPEETDMREQQIGRFAWSIVASNPIHALRAHITGFLRSWAPLEQSFWYAHLSGRRWEDTGVPAQSYRNAVEILLEGRLFEAIEVGIVHPWKQLDPLARLLWYGWGVAHALGIGLLVLGTWRMRRRPALLLAILITILYATFPPGPIGYVRFRVAVMPLIVVLVVSGIDWLKSAFGPLSVGRLGGSEACRTRFHPGFRGNLPVRLPYRDE